QLSSGGGRLIVSSDGVWDALSPETAFECCRGMPAEAAAIQIVEEAVNAKGLRDDTTCIVVDIQPREKKLDAPPPMEKKRNGAIFRKEPPPHLQPPLKKEENHRMDCSSVDELFEQGSALLSERLDSKYPICNMFKLFVCAICQLRLKPGEGVSVHYRTSNPKKLRSWHGPFLCSTCHEKKEAMEGKK
ncbi:hypothetical protein M569_16756, partial [Genlisea aurea]